MIIALFLFGAYVGWVLLSGFGGAMVVGLMGAMFGMVLNLQNKLAGLEERLRKLAEVAAAATSTSKIASTVQETPGDTVGITTGSDARTTESAAAAAAAETKTVENIPATAPSMPSTSVEAAADLQGASATKPVWPVIPPVSAPQRRDTPVPAAPVIVAQPSLSHTQAERVDTQVHDRPNDWIDTLFGRAWAWLTEGNLPVKMGIIVLIFGTAAAIQYAASSGWLTMPMPVRLALIAGIAIAGLGYGIRCAAERPAFGVAMQGGGLAVLLLVVFGAFARYQLISPTFAFACVVGLVATAAALSLRFNAPVLAVLGFLGGFLAPVLISTGSNSPVALFTYIALLDVAVVAIAWRRPWRALNLMAFAGTFLLGTLWGYKYYAPEFFYQVEPFLVMFFVFFAAIPLLYAKSGATANSSEQTVDSLLLFGTPLVAFPLQAALLGDDSLGLGLSALVVSVLYGVVAFLSRKRSNMTHLTQGSAALAVGFLAMAVPLALSGRWTSAAWALQGLIMVFVGLKQQRLLTRYAGIALIAMGAFAGLFHLQEAGYFTQTDRFLFNMHALDLAVLIFAPFLAAWLHWRASSQVASGALLALALAWWTTWGLREIGLNLKPWLAMASEPGFLGAAVALFAALTAALCAGLLKRMAWSNLAFIQAAASAAIIVLGFLSFIVNDHWFASPLWLFWPAVFIAWAVMPSLKKHADPCMPYLHLGALGLLVAGVSVSLWRLADIHGLGNGWQVVLAAVAPVILLALLNKRPHWAMWPLEDHSGRPVITTLVMLALGCGWGLAQLLSGNPAPLAFVPILNPLDVAILSGLLMGWRYRSVLVEKLGENGTTIALALGAWGTLTMIVLRSVYHLTDLSALAWSIFILVNPTAQVSLTVAWCVAGVIAWVMGSKRGLRSLWVFGATLLGIVLAKLMLLDRIWLGNLEGIAAFLVVGVLLVVVGRIAPSPPKHLTEAQRMEAEIDNRP